MAINKFIQAFNTIDRQASGWAGQEHNYYLKKESHRLTSYFRSGIVSKTNKKNTCVGVCACACVCEKEIQFEIIELSA